MIKNEQLYGMFFFMASISMFSFQIEQVKYIKYLILPLLLIYMLCMFSGNKKIFLTITPVDLAFLLVLCYGLLRLIGSSSVDGCKDLLFIACYSLPIVFLIHSKDFDIKKLFYLYCVLFVLSACLKFGGGVTISIMSSQSVFEGDSSFVFGAFAIWFMYQRSHLLALVSLFLVVLTLKRIALLGVMVCFLLIYFPRILERIATSKFFVVCTNLLFVWLVSLFTLGFLDGFIYSITGLPANHFSMGRQELYLGVVESVRFLSFDWFFGSGPGSVYEVSNLYHKADRDTAMNLHSDTLKIYVEYGVVIFISFFSLLASGCSKLYRLFVVYMMILFFTDNTFIYVQNMLMILYFMKKAYLAEDNSSAKRILLN